MSCKLHLLNANNCRICFEMCSFRQTNISEVGEIFHETTGYEVHLHDKPQKICDTCLDKMLATKMFKEMCEKSEIILQEMRHIPLKSEELEEPPSIFIKEELDIQQELFDNHDMETIVEYIPSVKSVGIKKRSRNWRYDDLYDHLHQNRVELTQIHRFVIDFEKNMPKIDLLPENLDKINYEDNTVIACSHCSYKTSDKSLIPDHCKTDCNSGKFRCPCSREFFTLDLLRKHISVKHPNKRVLYRQLQCNFCQFSCCYETTMEKHCRKMHNETWEKCLECEENYYCDDLKLQHVVFRCNGDDTTMQLPFKGIFGAASALSDVKEICEWCGESFRAMNELQLHIEKDHKNVRYECDLCGRSYNVKHNLKKHIEGTHISNVFQCEFCDRIFNSWNTRRMHIRAKHLENSRPHVCDVCGKDFDRPSMLKNHAATHSDMRPFSCLHCNASFKNKTRLTCHVRFQHSNMKLACQKCGKMFKNKPELKQHSLTHQGNKFFCPACPSNFSVNNSLRMHIARNHPEIELPPRGTTLRNVDLNELFAKNRQ